MDPTGGEGEGGDSTDAEIHFSVKKKNLQFGPGQEIVDDPGQLGSYLRLDNHKNGLKHCLVHSPNELIQESAPLTFCGNEVKIYQNSVTV